MTVNRVPFLLALALLGCEPPPPPIPGALPATGTPLVVVNGSNITQDMVDAQLRQLPDEVRANLEKSGNLSRITDNLVAQELLYQEALKRKLQDDPNMVIPLALAQRQILAQAALKKASEERLTDAVLQQWYQDHLVQYSKPQVSASRIVVETEAQANDLIAKAKGGADFATLARENSKDPAAKDDGGKIKDWLGQREVREPLASALFGAAKGDVVGPFPTNGGFQIIRVDDRRDQIPYEEVKDQVRSQAERETVQKYLDELEKAAKIEHKDGKGEDVQTPGAPTAPGAAGANPGVVPPGGMSAPPKLGAPARPGGAMPPVAPPAAPGSGG